MDLPSREQTIQQITPKRQSIINKLPFNQSGFPPKQSPRKLSLFMAFFANSNRLNNNVSESIINVMRATVQSELEHLSTGDFQLPFRKRIRWGNCVLICFLSPPVCLSFELIFCSVLFNRITFETPSNWSSRSEWPLDQLVLMRHERLPKKMLSSRLYQ